jgi:hypothetical protein
VLGIVLHEEEHDDGNGAPEFDEVQQRVEVTSEFYRQTSGAT